MEPVRHGTRKRGERPGALTPSLSRFRYQPACKPGSVGRRTLSRAARGGHSSGTMLAHGLEQPTRTASPTWPCGVIACANAPRGRPYSVLLPVGFALPSPLPATRCALTAPFHPYPSKPEGGGGRFDLCGTFPGVAPAGRYPAPYVDGARTFLPGHLSVIAGAAARPTDAKIHAAFRGWRQAQHPARHGRASRVTRAQRKMPPVQRAAATFLFPGWLASSACRVWRVEGSAMPSTLAGRKWRWNAVTTSRVGTS